MLKLININIIFSIYHNISLFFIQYNYFITNSNYLSIQQTNIAIETIT